MKLAAIGRIFPSWKNALLAVLAAVLLILAFPDLELWWTAWFALVPLMWAIEREKASTVRSLLLGWIFGTAFFFGTCWWLTFAPITYAGFPPVLAYFLMLCVAIAVGVFPAIFAASLAILLRRFGSRAFLAAPFVWVFTEFLRYWVTGNNWNAIGYSQAFSPLIANYARLGGVLFVSFIVCFYSSLFLFGARFRFKPWLMVALVLTLLIICTFDFWGVANTDMPILYETPPVSNVVAVQPNVPMSGLDYYKWGQLRQHQIDLAEAEIRKMPAAAPQLPKLVILPESPMNFMYEEDREFQQFVRDFTTRNNTRLLFNSAEPDKENGKYFNSAVMVNEQGKEIAQYDKIYLLPFGEAVPVPFESFVPGFVGNFSYGRHYELLPIGDAKTGVMICFESHFGQLSREYVRQGADAIIEMTNDGYLGPTPVLRQHLANAVFRAVETNRPLLRVTNVGVTAYITQYGDVLNPAPTYAEATRVWGLAKSDGSQTIYVKYGDWFAWLCSVTTLLLLALAFRKKKTTISS